MVENVYINFEKEVEGEKLEKILLDSAKEVGMKAESRDEYKEVIRLKPVRKEKAYKITHLHIHGVGYMNISIDKRFKTNYLHIDQYCLDPEFNKYLDAVSQKI